MSENQTADFIYIVLLLVLVGSAVVARRMPISQSLKMAGTWVLIFLAAFVLFQMKDSILGFANRVMDERKAESTGLQVGDTLVIKQSLDGHYWVDAEVNGTEVRFLVDSGATTTSISTETARRAGVEPTSSMPAMVETANGTVLVQRARAKSLQVGQIRREDVAMHVSESLGDTNVLGMNFLSSLSGWGVEQNRLVLKP